MYLKFHLMKSENKGENVVLLQQHCLIHTYVYNTPSGIRKGGRGIGTEGMKLSLGNGGPCREGVFSFGFVSHIQKYSS